MKCELKIYYQDNGWIGSIIVVSTSKEEAIELMKEKENYDNSKTIEEYIIKEGLTLCNLGDPVLYL